MKCRYFVFNSILGKTCFDLGEKKKAGYSEDQQQLH